MLQNMKKLPDTNDIEWELTIDSFKMVIRALNEGKFASALSRHYSIYKTLNSFPFTMSISVNLINKFLENNIMLECWTKVIQVMLCKVKEITAWKNSVRYS